MRHFIVSDLHGDGTMYDSIIGYMDNVANDSSDDITLHINGDLIDRGYDSARMLLDVYRRVKGKNSFKINYIGGNHELMLWQDSLNRVNGIWPSNTTWHENGGDITLENMKDELSTYQINRLVNFVGNLKLYYKFAEKLDGKNIVLVHAKCPDKVLYNCHLRIKDDYELIHDTVWYRKDDLEENQLKIGNSKYFTIIGHTPLQYPRGYKYYSDENYLNIDGGCGCYVLGCSGFDHVPLVEIDSNNNRLIILTFNNNNEIISGSYFSNGKSTPIRSLDKYKKYLDKDVMVRKLTYEDGKIFFV